MSLYYTKSPNDFWLEHKPPIRLKTSSLLLPQNMIFIWI